MAKGNSKLGGGGSGNNSVLTSFEREIYKGDTERAMVVTADGEVITYGGDENHVFGTNDDIKKLEGGKSTHNHPNNSIFSDTDVANGIARGNLQEMRIVTKSGETHSLINKGATEQQRRAFSAQYDNKMMKANNNVDAKLRRREKVDRQEYVNNFMERWLDEHASDYGFEYKKGRI